MNGQCSYVIIGGVVGGAAWYLGRLALGPTGMYLTATIYSVCRRSFLVVWTKSNPTPWNSVKPNENTKLMSVEQKFEKRCVS